MNKDGNSNEVVQMAILPAVGAGAANGPRVITGGWRVLNAISLIAPSLHL